MQTPADEQVVPAADSPSLAYFWSNFGAAAEAAGTEHDDT